MVEGNVLNDNDEVIVAVVVVYEEEMNKSNKEVDVIKVG